MPSLLGTTVTTNYLKATESTQFGTRALRFIKVTAVHSSAAVDFSKAVLAGTGVYTTSNSLFQKAVNALQGFAEVYATFAPGTAGFIVAIADDTVGEADSGNSGTGYGLLEAAIKSAIAADTSVTVAAVVIAGAGTSIS